MADSRADTLAKLGDLAAMAGLRRIHMLAWRDLADVEAGGSELHATTVARLWAEAGIEVTIRTSYAQGHPPESNRDGVRVIRRAGRYMIFPRAIFSEVVGRHGERDGLVEIWNGMPFWSPLWASGPRVVFLHHVHGAMWKMVLPPNLATFGETVEKRIAPPVYRRSRIITLSESSRQELIHDLRLKPDRVTVVPPGIDPRFTPGDGTEKSPVPLVVAVGRLMPVKRFDELIKVMAEVRCTRPDVELTIVGDGAERENLEGLVDDLDASEWVSMPGRLSDDALVDLYRRAWVLASASAAEGWGMTVTEAAACGTPAVVTDIAGHRDAVQAGVTGLLSHDMAALARDLTATLADHDARERMSAAGLRRAGELTWEATATGTLAALAGEATRLRRPRRTS
ncbi:MAG TPA: glycosyltransferase family 4 protein [Acidimicrobiales bacterium]|nr:glycosyltransferase family 4 protein [Acidimicrobiales bacterium]